MVDYSFLFISSKQVGHHLTPYFFVIAENYEHEY